MKTETNRQYALVWFEGDDPFTLVDKKGATVLLTKDDALRQASGVLETQDDVDSAEDDLRYAIATGLLEELYGWRQ